MHNVTLTIHATSGEPFSFDRADILRSGGLVDSPMTDTATRLDLSQLRSAPQQTVVPATNTSFFRYDDSGWAVTEDWQIPSKQNPIPYYKTPTGGTYSFSFRGSGVAINAARDWGTWLYTVVSSSRFSPSVIFSSPLR